MTNMHVKGKPVLAPLQEINTATILASDFPTESIVDLSDSLDGCKKFNLMQNLIKFGRVMWRETF